MTSTQFKIRTPEEAVQPSKSTESEFSSHLQRYAGRKDKGLVSGSVPEVQRPFTLFEDNYKNKLTVLKILVVRHNADPLLSLFTPIKNKKLVSVTTTSTILMSSVSYLHRLSQSPVVLHVSLYPPSYPCYSSITAIRNTGFIILHSNTLQEAQDMALTAHALAINTGKGVDDDQISFEDVTVVETVLNMDAVTAFHCSDIDDIGIYADTGKVATFAEPIVTRSLSHVSPESVKATMSPTLEPAKDPKLRNLSIYSTKENGRRSNDSLRSSNSLENLTDSVTVRAITSDDIYDIVISIWARIRQSLGREYTPFQYFGSPNAEKAIFVFGPDVRTITKTLESAKSKDVYFKAGIVKVRLYRPWLGSKLITAIPTSVKRIAVLEQIRHKTTKWGSLLLDLLTTLKSGPSGGVDTIVRYQLGYIAPSTVRQALLGVFQNLNSRNPVQNLEVGSHSGPIQDQNSYQTSQPNLEAAYMKILEQVFGKRLYIANNKYVQNVQNVGITSLTMQSPEFGFGALVARKRHRQRFIKEVEKAIISSEFNDDSTKTWLAKWTPNTPEEVIDEILIRLEADGSSLSRSLLADKGLFVNETFWLIGSDAWAYDFGNSGIHHVITSGQNINMLIIDSTPYCPRVADDAERRKKDIGAYAMNHGNTYVASCAVYSSYTQVLQAMIEADKFDGPSVILAYLPYFKEEDSPLVVLQETKKAVSNGYWPLYRWKPGNESNDAANFSLDSEFIKQEIKEFLDQNNHLTLLTKMNTEISSAIAKDCGIEIRDSQIKRAKDAYQKLLEDIMGAPLTILFCSDSENADKLAKRLGNRGKSRGLKTAIRLMEYYAVDELPREENIVFITSTTGQGEFPPSSRVFWDSIREATHLDLSSVKYSVFALGDSQYWPSPEDKHYYNKAGKDLDMILMGFGAKPLTNIDLLWQALNVDKVGGLPEDPPSNINEDVKSTSTTFGVRLKKPALM
ncbi:hypothetical protein BGHDH14_bgh06251 [Blumeria hordei DH14]|uniref:Flavodoxin-like domain-containing protein n=1 Tax=Blumeria graminis f. sp. hordei (strain DH14) TaxID=546991 RepID=N1J909_BLUG1|nr:hypothetical protein BGHDH14_bgh06251 [Blumeria hordei DH14]